MVARIVDGCSSLAIVALMQLLSGKDAAEHIAGIIHPKYQVHGFSVHLTVRKIYAIDPTGKLDFGGGEYVPAGRMEIAPHQLRPEDNYLWWELDRESYFVECNETLSLASDQIALIEPEDRLLRAGGWHVPLFVRGHVDPVELLLTVGVAAIAGEGKCAHRARAPVPHRRKGEIRHEPRARAAPRNPAGQNASNLVFQIIVDQLQSE